MSNKYDLPSEDKAEGALGKAIAYVEERLRLVSSQELRDHHALLQSAASEMAALKAKNDELRQGLRFWENAENERLIERNAAQTQLATSRAENQKMREALDWAQRHLKGVSHSSPLDCIHCSMLVRGGAEVGRQRCPVHEALSAREGESK